MESYKREFLDFAVNIEVLRFGEFTLKSGRTSPYFFNSGLFNSGISLGKLGRYYAQAIESSGIEFDMIYGPAYKGIPLAAATAIALADHHNRDIPYAFNRKEAKDHGEGGTTVGAPLKGKILIIDDVISAGTSARESVEVIAAQGAQVAGMVIALDRQERGQGERSAVQEVEKTQNIKVACIITLSDLVEYLEDKEDKEDSLGKLDSIRAYRQRYGV